MIVSYPSDEIPSGLMENHPTQSGSMRGRKKDTKQDSDTQKNRLSVANPVGDIDKMKVCNILG